MVDEPQQRRRPAALASGLAAPMRPMRTTATAGAAVPGRVNHAAPSSSATSVPSRRSDSTRPRRSAIPAPTHADDSSATQRHCGCSPNASASRVNAALASAYPPRRESDAPDNRAERDDELQVRGIHLRHHVDESVNFRRARGIDVGRCQFTQQQERCVQHRESRRQSFCPRSVASTAARTASASVTSAAT
jgi:hypothetical protein